MKKFVEWLKQAGKWLKSAGKRLKLNWFYAVIVFSGLSVGYLAYRLYKAPTVEVVPVEPISFWAQSSIFVALIVATAFISVAAIIIMGFFVDPRKFKWQEKLYSGLKLDKLDEKTLKDSKNDESTHFGRNVYVYLGGFLIMLFMVLTFYSNTGIRTPTGSDEANNNLMADTFKNVEDDPQYYNERRMHYGKEEEKRNRDFEKLFLDDFIKESKNYNRNNTLLLVLNDTTRYITVYPKKEGVELELIEEKGEVFNLDDFDKRARRAGVKPKRVKALKGFNFSVFALALQQKGVKIHNDESTTIDQSAWGYWIWYEGGIWLIVIVGVFAIWITRGSMGHLGGWMQFTKSRAKRADDSGLRVTFADVAGVDEAKEELEEVVEFLRSPQKFQEMGSQMPKGVLLAGAPGTGKTLLARAVAGEANVPFFSVSGSDFVEGFVGVGAGRVRDTFAQGQANAPCIIFIDELDAVGKARGGGGFGGHDEREQTLNALLVEIDGFDTSGGIVLLGATNRPDTLDPALLRAGRFTRKVVVPLPDKKARAKIFAIHLKKIKVCKQGDYRVDIERLAQLSPTLSGADIADIVNEASLLAVRQDKKQTDMRDLLLAMDKVLLGKKSSITVSEWQKWMTVYHELGHALIAYWSKEIDPLEKVSAIPRGMTMGVTVVRPEEDIYSRSREYYMHYMLFGLGGRAAEEICNDSIYGEGEGWKYVSTGAHGDFVSVQAVAKMMVAVWGMSKELGIMGYGQEQLAGGPMGVNQVNSMISPETLREIEVEARDILNKRYKRTKILLKGNWHLMEALAPVLFEKEEITGEELEAILKEKGLSVRSLEEIMREDYNVKDKTSSAWMDLVGAGP